MIKIESSGDATINVPVSPSEFQEATLSALMFNRALVLIWLSRIFRSTDPEHSAELVGLTAECLGWKSPS